MSDDNKEPPSGVQRYQAANVLQAGRPGFWVHAGDYNAHVTRLNAEVQRLENERASAVERCHEFRTGYRGAQDELTKAQALLVKCDLALEYVGMQDHFIDYEFTALVRKELKNAIAQQSAPAAKGLTEESRQEAIERHFGHFGDGV